MQSGNLIYLTGESEPKATPVRRVNKTLAVQPLDVSCTPVCRCEIPGLKHECDVAEYYGQWAYAGLRDRRGHGFVGPKTNSPHAVQVRLLLSRSLNIPRPPRVDGGGLPLCGMPLTNVAVLQLDAQQVKAAA